VTEYDIVYQALPSHFCGLVTDFPDVPVGSVIRCKVCGRHWKRRKDFDGAYDVPQHWTWERLWERRRRLGRQG
jgi:hypothetical protein